MYDKYKTKDVDFDLLGDFIEYSKNRLVEKEL